MTMKRDYEKAGGPAFGVHHPDIEPYAHGMTVRDWFAGMAMQALVSASSVTYLNCGKEAAKGGDFDYHATWPATRDRCNEQDEHAETAYLIADAMMRAREVPANAPREVRETR